MAVSAVVVLSVSMRAQADITEILGNFLFLAGRRGSDDAELLREHRITLVVNVTPYPARHPEAFRYINLALNDLAEENIGVHFHAVANAIENEKAANGRVLVHCQAGASRSATIVIAYLVKCHGMSLADAHAHVKHRRPQTRPNDGFWQQLIEYELFIHGSNTVVFEPDGRGGVWPSVYAEQQRQKQKRAAALNLQSIS